MKVIIDGYVVNVKSVKVMFEAIDGIEEGSGKHDVSYNFNEFDASCDVPSFQMLVRRTESGELVGAVDFPVDIMVSQNC